MKRSAPPVRRTRLKRGKPPRSRNAERRKREFARCYHSRERVAWVRSLPCIWCGAAPCDNAHVSGSDGMSRKGPYEEIAPMCREDHSAYDDRRPPYDNPEIRLHAELMAEITQANWLRMEVRE